MTENDLSGEFSGIFDDLDPSHFLGQATLDAYTDNVGSEKFEQFCATLIDAIRLAFLASDGDDINAIAVLANPEKAVAFVGDDEETMGQYMERLGAEAARLGATWFFMCHFTDVGMHVITSEDQITDVHARNGEELSRGAFIYARRREGDESVTKQFIALVYGNRLGELQAGPENQPAQVFDKVLDGVDKTS